MELKEYQTRALEAFSRWLAALDDARRESAAGTEALRKAGVEIPADLRNYPKTAWGKLADAGGVAAGAARHADRSADAGFPIPHACFKVPTGGGKTLLVAAALTTGVRVSEPSGVGFVALGETLFTDWAVPFEVASLALLVALIGAVALVRRERDGD